MANTIGSIGIEMFADLARMVSDLGKAQQESAKAARAMQEQWQGTLDGIQEGFQKLAEFAGFAITVDALKDVVAHSLDAAEKVDNLSQALGLSTQTIQTLGYAAGLVGADLDTASTSMARMERSAEQAVAGNKQAAEAFHSVGIEAGQLKELLKDPDALIQQVAAHFSEFGNGAGKTAAVMQIFGRNAQQMIPFLNEIGTSFAQLRQRAEDLGVVLSDADQHALADAQHGFNELHQQVIGLGNQFTIALLPAINSVRDGLADLLKSGAVSSWVSGFATGINQVVVMLGQLKAVITEAIKIDPDSIGWNDVVGDVANIGRAFVNLENWAEDVFVRLELIIEDLWVGFQNDVKDAVSAAKVDLAGLFDFLSKGLQFISPDAALGLKALATSLLDSSKDFTYATVDVGKYTKAIDDNAQMAFEAKVGIDQWAAGVRSSANELGTSGAALDHVNKLQVDYNANAGASSKALDGARAAFQKFTDSLNSSGLSGYDKDFQQYLTHVNDVHDLYLRAREAGMSFEEATRLETIALNANNNELARQDNLLNQGLVDALDKINTKYQEQVDSLKGVTQAQEIEKQYLQDLAIYQVAWNKAKGDGVPIDQETLNSLHAMSAAHVQYLDQLKLSEAALKEWEQIATNAFDSAFTAINKDIIEGGSVMKDLVNVAKQVVEAVLLEFEKLAIINPLMNQLFGLSGSSLLPTLFNTAAGGAGSSGGLIGSLFGAGLGGKTAGTDPDFLPGGALSYDGFGSSFGYGSLGSTLLGAAGGAFAGYNEFKSAGGGIAGLAGGAAYGVGTFALGGALSAGISAAAAGGLSAGMAAGFAAIGPIGWVALAAMAVNMVTGGGLFGTDAKPYGSEENLTVGPGGAGITAAIDEKGKKALFQGSYWKTVSTPVDQATQDSVAQFFAGLQAAADAEAKSFGETTSTVVGGSFHETFDKAGKMLTQASTVLGQTFSESIQDFQSRVMADTLLANMGAASAEAQKIADQWQSTASTLLAGAEFLSQAELDISQGHALVQGDTLTQLTDFVQGLEAQGETLIQTYARLSAETTVVTGVLSTLDMQSGKTGEALVSFSDDMVKAAGGIDNLNSLATTFFQDYFTPAEQAAAKLKSDQANATSALKAIGQDPNESMAQFKTAFNAVSDTLSGADYVKWFEAGIALAQVNADLGTTAAGFSNLSDYMKQFTDAAPTDFENSISGLNDTMQKNIDTANSYGASVQDIGTIMEYSAKQGAAAFAAFEQQVQQLASSLYGSNIDALNAQIAQLQGTQFGLVEIPQLQAQIDAINQQAAAAKRLTDASTLLQDFGQVGAFTGENLDAIAKQFGVPLDKFANDLGLDSAGLSAAFAHQEDLANAALQQVNLLTDIRDLLEGKPIPVVDSRAVVQPAIGGKVTRDAIPATTFSSDDGAERIVGMLGQVVTEIQRLRGTAGSQPPSNRRNGLSWAIPA